MFIDDKYLEKNNFVYVQFFPRLEIIIFVIGIKIHSFLIIFNVT